MKRISGRLLRSRWRGPVGRRGGAAVDLHRGSAAPSVGAAELAARRQPARRRECVQASDRGPSRKLDRRARHPGAPARGTWRPASRGAWPMQAASAGIGAAASSTSASKRDARQHRLAREVAVEGRMVGGDLDACRGMSTERHRPVPLRARAAASAASARLVSLPVGSRGSASTCTIAPRQEGGVDALAQRRQDLLPRRASARRRRRSGASRRSRRLRRRGGNQKAPSTTPSIAFRWKFRCPSELRLPAMLTRSFERPSSRKRPASRTSSTSASGVGSRHVAAAHARVARRRRPGAGRRRCATRRPRSCAASRPGRPRCSRRSRAAAPQAPAPRAPRAAATSGAVAQTSRSSGGSARPDVEQRLQVERRRHQDARRRQRGEAPRRRRPDRTAGRRRRRRRRAARSARSTRSRTCAAAARWRRAPSRRGRACRRLGEPTRLGRGVAHQQAPGLGVRHRVAGRARGEDVRGDEVGIDRGTRAHAVACRGGRRRVGDRRQAVAVAARIDQGIGAA